MARFKLSKQKLMNVARSLDEFVKSPNETKKLKMAGVDKFLKGIDDIIKKKPDMLKANKSDEYYKMLNTHVEDTLKPHRLTIDIQTTVLVYCSLLSAYGNVGVTVNFEPSPRVAGEQLEKLDKKNISKNAQIKLNRFAGIVKKKNSKRFSEAITNAKTDLNSGSAKESIAAQTEDVPPPLPPRNPKHKVPDRKPPTEPPEPKVAGTPQAPVAPPAPPAPPPPPPPGTPKAPKAPPAPPPPPPPGTPKAPKAPPAPKPPEDSGSPSGTDSGRSGSSSSSSLADEIAANAKAKAEDISKANAEAEEKRKKEREQKSAGQGNLASEAVARRDKLKKVNQSDIDKRKKGNMIAQITFDQQKDEVYKIMKDNELKGSLSYLQNYDVATFVGNTAFEAIYDNKINHLSEMAVDKDDKRSIERAIMFKLGQKSSGRFTSENIVRFLYRLLHAKPETQNKVKEKMNKIKEDPNAKEGAKTAAEAILNFCVKTKPTAPKMMEAVENPLADAKSFEEQKGRLKKVKTNDRSAPVIDK